MFNISLKYFVALPVAILFISATNPSEFAASLNSIGISYKVGYSVAIALRYIPDIQRDYHSISQAQQARGVELGKSEPFFARLKNSVSILLPLILTGLRPPVGKVKNGPLGWFSGKSAAAPLAVMRSGWEPDAVYFGLTAGSPRRNHGHMDCGAFIYEADGVRWAMDLGAQNYSKLEKVLQIWDMKQDSERWQVFRYGADSHNIARIGGQPQRVDGKGAITAASGNMIEADLTPVYAGGAERVVRRAGLAADRTLTLTDTLQGVKPGEIISWQMCTRAEAATQTDGSLLLTQGKAFLRLEKNMPGAWEVVAEEELLKPFDQKTGKVKMVRFTVPAPASGAVELSVRFLPGGK